MADYDKAMGLLSGLQRGIGSYVDASKNRENLEYQRERDKRAQEQQGLLNQMALKKSGLLQTDEGLVDDPAYYDRLRKELEIKKSFQSDSMSPLDRLRFEKLMGDVQAQKKESIGGKQLPPDKVLAVQQGSQIPKMLTDVEQVLQSTKDISGPFQGRLAAADPYNVKARSADAQIRAASQAFGRLMEGGVLRKEDEAKYYKMFPQLSDTPDIQANKLQIVRKMMADKQAADIKALGGSGYDVSAFETPKSVGLPQILQPQQAQGAQGTQPPNGQQRVMQNGFEYIWNPRTGQYE